jgi:hypothetical protein
MSVIRERFDNVASQEIVSLRFIRPDVAIAETLTWISGFSKAGPPPGTQLDANGRLRTRLLQLLKKDGGDWKIVAITMSM